LSEIPWLLEELDTRIACFDRVTHGTIGRRRTGDIMTVIDFDAAEIARIVRKMLLRWVQTVAENAIGCKPTGLHTRATPDFARWLAANIRHIARMPFAGKLYDDIDRIVGAGNTKGQLLQAINPHEHHLVGPCPTIVGRNHDGTPRQCGHMLFADTYDKTTLCPRCRHDIDVEQTRRASAAARDLHTRDSLLEVLTNIDEPITAAQLNHWIGARRLRPAGYHHDGTILESRIHPNDEPVYSLSRARRVRRRDQQHLTNAQS
jgi:predicted Zn-ribbon and HTH transcriptional regulator